MYIPKNLITDFFEDINQFDVRYVLIKNIGSELPDRLVNGKDIDILVFEEDKNTFQYKMESKGFQNQTPPFGRQNGWAFAYNLPEYQFWKKDKAECEFYIDACFKLCCKSLMPKVWIPLDQKINDDIWKNRVWDEKNQWWIMDEKTMLVYLVVRAIFDKRCFNDDYISEIEQRRELLENPEVVDKLKLVFFKFTDTLTDMLLKRHYEAILERYITFVDY